MLGQVALTRHFGGCHCHMLLALVSIFAKFRIRGPARCVGLDDEANVFPSTGGDGRGHFFNIPRGRSGNTRADSTLMPGHTTLAPGTHGSYMDTVRGGAGGPVSATSRGPGTPHGHFSNLLGGLRGLRGLLRMICISVAHHTARPLSPALLHQPLGNCRTPVTM